jgi:hypothetical protein
LQLKEEIKRMSELIKKQNIILNEYQLRLDFNYDLNELIEKNPDKYNVDLKYLIDNYSIIKYYEMEMINKNTEISDLVGELNNLQREIERLIEENNSLQDNMEIIKE